MEEGCSESPVSFLQKTPTDSRHVTAMSQSRLLKTANLCNRYHSIRIDSVHYCEREALLSDKRKRRTFFDRNGEPEDTAQARLKLLCRTLREDPARLGPIVEYFKTPYMLREASQADLARTIAVLPNLRYVDLPEGLYTDEAPYITLRLEIQARCHNLRKMTYMTGSEKSLEALAGGRIWRNLEVLDLVKINMDPIVILHALAMLGNLRALKITGSSVFTDEILAHGNEMLPSFPPLEELILNKVPGITATGLKIYLSRRDTQNALKVLTLTSTGVKPWTLQEVLANATSLKSLSINETVSAALPTAAGTNQIPPLNSASLQTLHYEIVPKPSSSPYKGVVTSYYNYLSGSLLMGGLPNLRALYVRDANFPDTLLGLPPPAPTFADSGFARPASSGSSSAFSSQVSYNNLGPALSPVGFLSPNNSPGFQRPPPQTQNQNTNPFQSPPQSPPSTKPWTQGHNPRFSSNNPFAAFAGPGGPSGLPQTLEVFTKGDDELDWSFVKVEPGHAATSRRTNAARPVSSYGLDNTTLGWNSGAGARKSVFMGNGVGGFLAVPDPLPAGAARRRSDAQDEWPRPKSSAGEKKRDKLDLWR